MGISLQDFVAWLAANIEKAPMILADLAAVWNANTPNERISAIIKLVMDVAGLLRKPTVANAADFTGNLATLKAAGVDVDSLQKHWKAVEPMMGSLHAATPTQVDAVA